MFGEVYYAWACVAGDITFWFSDIGRENKKQRQRFVMDFGRVFNLIY
jgi:hypothetical protein